MTRPFMPPRHVTHRRTPRSSWTLAVAVAVATLALAACGGGSPPTPAGGGSGGPSSSAAPPTVAAACDLLTDGDLAAILGTTVVTKEDNVADTVYKNHCRWTLQRPDGGSGTLDLGVLSPEGRQRYDVTSEQSAFEPFEGLPADDAGGDPQSASIFAVRGDTLIDVYALGLGLSRATTGEVARRVLERLFGDGPTGTAAPASPATGGNGGSVSDPCTLLTDAEILEVTGAAALRHTGSPWFGQWDVTCTWEMASEGLLPASIELFLKSPGGRASWDQYMVPIQGEFTAVPGLGDAAFAKVHWPTHVLVGDAYLSVQFVGDPDPEEPISTELAERVVSHLGG